LQRKSHMKNEKELVDMIKIWGRSQIRGSGDGNRQRACLEPQFQINTQLPLKKI
jgi:hypothetical protein